VQKFHFGNPIFAAQTTNQANDRAKAKRTGPENRTDALGEVSSLMAAGLFKPTAWPKISEPQNLRDAKSQRR
jgi:hypothetical protein